MRWRKVGPEALLSWTRGLSVSSPARGKRPRARSGRGSEARFGDAKQQPGLVLDLVDLPDQLGGDPLLGAHPDTVNNLDQKVDEPVGDFPAPLPAAAPEVVVEPGLWSDRHLLAQERQDCTRGCHGAVAGSAC